MTEIEDFWRELPIFAAFPAQLAFVLIFSIPSLGAGQWWRVFVGRALFTKSATLAFLLAAACVQNTSELLDGHRINWSWNFSFIDGLVVLGYWAVTAAIYYQLGALLKQRFKRLRTARRIRILES